MKLPRTLALTGALLVYGCVTAAGQVVSPPNSTVSILNWRPATNPDALAIDLDGDNIPDVTFTDSNTYPTGGGQPELHTFSVSPRSSAQLALDSVEFDSAHRFAAGDGINRLVLWSSGGGYVAYTIQGNGGLGGRGFFRDGQTGFIVVRKSVANSGWRYWWINVQARTYGVGVSIINFYGQSAANPLASVPRQSVSFSVFPNPTIDGWFVDGNGQFTLLNVQGRVVASGQLANKQFLDGRDLVSGIYLLLLQRPDGSYQRQTLLRN
ncbi:T9SS type A sorting domain-containing protein [Hymenobacter rubripertinctus]|uniref:T9SS C-terminal target domain-containing protein n=1 Tax=Hymenobacter rubripertinctus TaxID=2029981 RepID=A0A418R971_9BACT|nr:T9SS type A sorting domain-containing protein [Hymenobacter rubripertinctus]RIY14170.1 T9SS C-terminal target domain-containing protein [Hymenobacter rubripertinctus]